MKFGPVPLAEAEGAILAHSVGLAAGRLKKGRRLSAADIAALAAEGMAEVTVARLGQTDVPEDPAAARIGAALAPEAEAQGLVVSAPFTGRVNLYAVGAGVLRLDAALIGRLNAIDEAITVATLPDHARVAPRQMLATVKIIPYAAPGTAVAAAEAMLAGGAAIRVNPLARKTASLILTRTPGMAEKLVTKGAEAVRARVAALGIELVSEVRVAHVTADLARAVAGAPGEMVLILTGSATSDRNDVGPAALVAAGGRLIRFGMPVDPGNLLFLGELAGRPVIGLPGCARSPKLNGADWVLERVACGLDPTTEEIAAMAVGGLLKEIPSRPEPRAGGAEAVRRPVVSALVLAAGRSSRMGGRDKLLEPVAGVPLLRHVVQALAASAVDEIVVVLPPEPGERLAALAGTAARPEVRIVTNPRAAEGMGTSVGAGVTGLRADADAVLIVLADMPEVTARDFDRLIAAFDPAEGRAIVRAVTEAGRPGHPVLFGRRFFEPLRALEGDRGARSLIEDYPEFLVDVVLPGGAAATDLDTPEDWDAWRAGRGGA
ncbi:MAG: molybdopterin-binding/glycosyltransferase family 2 protein [Proteobacteria bacterium]|nr:molybdopterin-binding/glycosyltransferase family 2 protein [Pseudomonadota bacterium]